MTHNDSFSPALPLVETIDRMAASYGPIPVLIAAVAAIFRQRRGPPPLTEADKLPPHLRRDVGLPEIRTQVRDLHF